ncbi:MAG: hypothetical protein FJ404_18220 [Verrucomicrobia bacterium]|nr:hypothetical protein [Verrucomicrobiota bacterium]
MNRPTPAQERAIRHRGDLLVSAGAGAGKTSTLVKRCLEGILQGEPRLSVERLLMVTFTEAAGTEMRQRLREGLEAAREAWTASAQLIEEQLALLDSAMIGTLHAACLRIVRDNAHTLGIESRAALLDGPESDTLARQTFSDLLESKLRVPEAKDAAWRCLLRELGGDADHLWPWIQQIHAHARSLPHPDDWFRHAEKLQSPDVRTEAWSQWARVGLKEWTSEMLELVDGLEPDFPQRDLLQGRLQSCLNDPVPPAAALAALVQFEATEAWPKRQAKRCRDRIRDIIEGAQFWRGQFADPQGFPAAGECTTRALALIAMTRDFTQAFDRAKRERHALDFQDLEQLTLSLLWNPRDGQLTPLARSWRDRFDQVIVDEFQDINAAQDRIIEALSHEGKPGNRLLVGDARQSIYRFRQADPRIFLDYEKRWKTSAGSGATHFLSENFRSHQRILDFVNAVFSQCMNAGLDASRYPASAELQAGSPETRSYRLASATTSARASLWILDASSDPDQDPSPTDFLEPWLAEAQFALGKLQQARANGLLVWDDGLGRERPMDWGDVAILLRSPRSGSWAFSQVFAEAGIPLSANKEGFFETSEIMDALSLLAVLDNPLQDIPLLAVLRSPLAEFTDSDLALIRAATPREPYWTALRRFPSASRDLAESLAAQHPALSFSPPPEASGPSLLDDIASAQAKVIAFLNQFDRWRRQMRDNPVSEALESILDEAAYETRTRHLPAADDAALPRLLNLMRRFDPLRGQGLHRFMKWIETRRAVSRESESAFPASPGAVRLLSIHKSKGLEFPVVLVAGLGSRFNFESLQKPVLLDDTYGVCLKGRLPGARITFPTLPYWLAARRQRGEMLAEELRLLYVAFTRAKDHLFLCGSAKYSSLATTASKPCHRLSMLKARNPLDWLAMAMAGVTRQPEWHISTQGESDRVRWTVESETSLVAQDPKAAESAPPILPAETEVSAWRARLQWHYPFPTATQVTAKVSVSALRAQLEEARVVDWTPRFPADSKARPASRSAASTTRRVRAAELGAATHALLEHLPLESGAPSAEVLRQLAGQLAVTRIISQETLDSIDYEAIAAFWQSALGQEWLLHPGQLRRELAFTNRWSPSELGSLGLSGEESGLTDEDGFIVVQGVVDLALILPDRIRILDFKTDRVRNDAELHAALSRYEPQLQLYAGALAGIYRRPVIDAWLHFLHRRQSVAVKLPNLPRC